MSENLRLSFLVKSIADMLVNRMLNVPRKTYQRVLYEAAVREGVKVRFGVRVESLDETQPSVKLSSGEIFEADLIIGADGTPSHSTWPFFAHAETQSKASNRSSVQPFLEPMMFSYNQTALPFNATFLLPS